MKYKSLALAASVLGSGMFVAGQQPATSGVFTSAQAEAGRKAYESTCGKCHTLTLQGRKGDPGELPPVSSLPASYQDMASGIVPPLAGKDFMNKWGSHTAAQLTQRIWEAVGAFPPEGAHSPVAGRVPPENDAVSVNIAAYVLQVNGAKAGTQPLTKTTDVVVRSVTADQQAEH
ncbi:MAG TPA: hypothetical protein VGG72_11705 [Bryobacteraceae bacterium]|jgi:mono/diheme cytochrome c family protein